MTEKEDTVNHKHSIRKANLKINTNPGIILLFIFIFIAGGYRYPGTKSGWDQLPEILNRIVPPTFPGKTYNILDYGAVGDGITDCSNAFEKAIDLCHNNGGGRVMVPEGIFLTGAIHLKSNIDLHISGLATLKFSRDPAKYLPPVFSRWEGVECINYSPFIYAYEQENIAITGNGTLDGQANNQYWWPWKGRAEYGWKQGQENQNKARQKLFDMAENNIPVNQRIMGAGSCLRPQFIQPYKCKNVLIRGITIKNSPMWEIHPVLCENVIVQNITVISHGPNNDGCDPESCKDVLIKDCYFNTGDDCIAIKSGRNTDGRRLNIPSMNIIVQNCEMKDGHGGLVIGSEISGNVKNIFIENCIMDSPNLDRALRIKSNSIRGGVVENIHVRNITIGQVSDAILRINLNYEEGDAGAFTPVIRNIHLQKVTSEKSNYALRIEGYKRSPVSHIYIKDCKFNNVKKENVLKYVENLNMLNVKIR